MANNQTTNLDSTIQELSIIFELSSLYDQFLGEFIDSISLLRIVRDSMGEELTISESQDRKKILSIIINRFDKMHSILDYNLEKWLEGNLKDV